MTLGTFKVMLQRTIIRNDDFLRNTARVAMLEQCCNVSKYFRNNVLREKSSLQIVRSSFFVYSQIIDTPDSLIVHLFHQKH